MDLAQMWQSIYHTSAQSSLTFQTQMFSHKVIQVMYQDYHILG